MTVSLGVAQLSFWFGHADGFCKLAQRHPGVELRAVWDDDVSRGQSKAATYGTDFEGDLDKLLARDDIQAVSLCAEPFRHPELVEAAAAAGKDIVIEKAMAGDLGGAARIVKAVQKHGVRLFPAFNLAWNPVPQLVKEIVDGGRLGTLSRVRRSHGHYAYGENGDFGYPAIGERAGWVDPVAEKRGSLYFVGAHSALWFQWMFGPPASVAAMTSTLSDGLPVEDNSTVLLRYPPGSRPGHEKGFVGIMESSFTQGAAPLVAQLSGRTGDLVQYRGDLPSTRVWGPQPLPLAIFDRYEQAWTYPELPPYFTRSEFAYSPHGRFLEALVADKPLPVDEVDGYNSIAILAAAEQADRSGSETPVATWLPVDGGAGRSASKRDADRVDRPGVLNVVKPDARGSGGANVIVRADEIRDRVDELRAAAGWLPYLPLRFARDVTAARQAIADGVVGKLADISVVSYFGAPPARGWDDDEARPRSSFEASVWMLDLIEYVLRAAVARTTWLLPPMIMKTSDAHRTQSLHDHGATVAVHELATGIVASVRHVPADRGPGPAFSATVIGERGQLLLRQPFAPGGLAIWHGEAREMTVPALPKPNRAGESVSTSGGWESHALSDVDPADRDAMQADALRIVGHLAMQPSSSPGGVADRRAGTNGEPC